MDSPYDVAMQLTRFSHYLEIPDILKNISLEDILREGLSFLTQQIEQKLSCFQSK